MGVECLKDGNVLTIHKTLLDTTLASEGGFPHGEARGKNPIPIDLQGHRYILQGIGKPVFFFSKH